MDQLSTISSVASNDLMLFYDVSEAGTEKTKSMTYAEFETQISGSLISPHTGPAGSDNEIQFNDNGSFGGNSNLTWNGSNVQIGTSGLSLSTAGNIGRSGGNIALIGGHGSNITQTANVQCVNNGGVNIRGAHEVAAGFPGGDVTLTAGDGLTTGDGGDVILTPGSGGASGDDGAIQLSGPTTFGAYTISGTGDIYCNDIHTASGTVYIGETKLSTSGGNLIVNDTEYVVTGGNTGVTSLYADGQITFETYLTGSNGGFRSYNPNISATTYQYHNAVGHYFLENTYASGTLNLRARATGGAYRYILAGDPDGATNIYHAGNKTLETANDGSSHGIIIYNDYDNYPNDGLAIYAPVGETPANWNIYSLEPGAEFLIRGKTTASGNVAMVEFNPDEGASLYYSGTKTVATNSYDYDSITHRGLLLDNNYNSIRMSSTLNSGQIKNLIHMHTGSRTCGAGMLHTNAADDYKMFFGAGYNQSDSPCFSIHFDDTSDEGAVYSNGPAFKVAYNSVNDGGWLGLNINNMNHPVELYTPSAEAIMIGKNNAEVELYYNGTEAFSTSTNGINIYDTAGDDPRLNFKDNGGTTQGNLQFYNGGSFQIYDDANTDYILTHDANGSTKLYHDGTSALETTTAGVYIKDTSANAFSMQLFSDNLYITNEEVSGKIILRSYDSGSTLRTMIECNANGASYMYRAGQGIAIGTGTAGIYHYDPADGGKYAYNYWSVNDHLIRNYVHGGDLTFLAENASGSAKGVSIDSDGGRFIPWTDNSHDCGSSSRRWDDIYATNTTIQSSDERAKTTISGSDLGLNFINQLNPVSYKFKDYDYVDITDDGEDAEGNTISGTVVSGTHEFHRTHYGLIAQDVLTTLSGLGKSTEDFAGYIHNVEDDYYGLRYNEFMAPVIKAIQELSDKVDDLTTRIEALEA